MAAILSLVWHVFEWGALIGVLLVAAWAMSFNVRIGGIGPEPNNFGPTDLAGDDAMMKDLDDSNQLADALIGLPRLVLRLPVRVVATVFRVATWPLRWADARDWQLRRPPRD